MNHTVIFLKKKFFKTLFHRSSWIQSPTPLKTIHKKTTKLGGGGQPPPHSPVEISSLYCVAKSILT